jgi:hypothetical protein
MHNVATLLSLWKAHPANLSPELLSKLKAVLLARASSQGVTYSAENFDDLFWGSFRELMRDEDKVILASIDLMAACAGSKPAMVRLARALVDLYGQGDEYRFLQRGNEWQRLAETLDLNGVAAGSAILERIKREFYNTLYESVALLSDEAWDVLLGRTPAEEKPTMVVLQNRPAATPSMGPEYEQISALASPIPLARAPNPDLLRDRLRAEFPWAKHAIDEVFQAVAQNHRNGDAIFGMPPILLVGHPGCGKTRFCRRVGELAGIPNETISFAGMADARQLLGTSKGWGSATASFPLAVIARSQIGNPLLIVDEIEKAQVRGNGGDVHAGMLNFLEPENSHRFLDLFANVRADLSKISWIATANDISWMPTSLLSRFSIIRFPNPTADHFDAVLASILADQGRPSLEPEVVAFLRERFATGSVSVRALARSVKTALAVADNRPESMPLN